MKRFWSFELALSVPHRERTALTGRRRAPYAAARTLAVIVAAALAAPLWPLSFAGAQELNRTAPVSATAMRGGGATAAGTARASGIGAPPANGKSRRESNRKLRPNGSSTSDFPKFSLSTKNGPIDIKSDKLSLNYKTKTVLFSGHVRVVQSGSEMTSDTLRVNYLKDFDEVKDAVADGNVRLSQGGRWATSDHAVADEQRHTVVLTGNPVVHDGPDQIAGKKIIVYLKTGQSVVEGGAHAVLYPHNKGQRSGESKTLTSAQEATTIREDPKK